MSIFLCHSENGHQGSLVRGVGFALITAEGLQITHLLDIPDCIYSGLLEQFHVATSH